jgi:hypothetical protein
MCKLFVKHFCLYEPAILSCPKAELASGAVFAQSQAQIHGAMPGGHALPSSGGTVGTGVSGMDQAVFGVLQGSSD